MLNTLDRYIGKNILVTIFITLFALVGLSAVIKFIDQLHLLNDSYRLIHAILFALLTIPRDIEIFFPNDHPSRCDYCVGEYGWA